MYHLANKQAVLLFTITSCHHKDPIMDETKLFRSNKTTDHC